MNNLRTGFVRKIYATHNDSSVVRDALSRCLGQLDSNTRGLNVGAGSTRLHPSIINLDLVGGETVDCQALAQCLPFLDSTFALVVTQETLEHVDEPFQAVKEACRVLSPGGVLYCQLPFIIGYHPGPTDFWRFTVEGIRTLVESAGFECVEVSVSVGPATGFYRISVEFFAILASALGRVLYYPAKALGALLFYPLKWLDPWLMRSHEADRIAGGYFVIARKPGERRLRR